MASVLVTFSPFWVVSPYIPPARRHFSWVAMVRDARRRGSDETAPGEGIEAGGKTAGNGKSIYFFLGGGVGNQCITYNCNI